MWDLKKYNKLVKITKKKQTDGYREQTGVYRWGRGWRSSVEMGNWRHRKELDMTELLNNDKVLKGQMAGMACAGGLPQLEGV